MTHCVIAIANHPQIGRVRLWHINGDGYVESPGWGTELIQKHNSFTRAYQLIQDADVERIYELSFLDFFFPKGPWRIWTEYQYLWIDDAWWWRYVGTQPLKPFRRLDKLVNRLHRKGYTR